MGLSYQVYVMAGWRVPTEGLPETYQEKMDALVDYYMEEADQSKDVMAVSDQWSGEYYLVGRCLATVDPVECGEVHELAKVSPSVEEEYKKIVEVLPMVDNLLDPKDMKIFVISHAW